MLVAALAMLVGLSASPHGANLTHCVLRCGDHYMLNSELLRLCTSSRKAELQECVSYIEAAVDLADGLHHTHVLPSRCRPQGTKIGVIKDAVVSDLKRMRPKWSDDNAALTVLDAVANLEACMKWRSQFLRPI
jgi:hypothetical protein